MRTASLLLAVLAVTASIGPVTAASDTAVRITEVHPRPASDGREFIELWNTGDTTIDLAGWNLTDGVNTFTFDAWSLGPGERVVVWGGGNDSALGPTWKANVWNNGGDPVLLHDADGTLVDQMEYGPDGDVPAPGEGVSLHWDGAWSTGDPTPGQDPQGGDGGATITVDDLPPEVIWVEAPTTVRPGDNTTVRFSVEDPNGDVLSWIVHAGNDETGNGTSNGTHTVNATAPDASGAWTWTVTAASTDQQTVASIDIQVSIGPFRIVLPEAGIRFPDLVPGATDVDASAPFQIIHQGDQAATPYLDISPFQGTDRAIEAAGNLHLVVRDASNTTTDIPYDAPLQALPTLEPGDTLDVTLVIHQVPEPLPAGDYRSSFTVVA